MPIRITKLEREILELLASGYSEREVCARTGLTERRLEETWQKLAEKFQVNSPRNEEEFSLFHLYEKVERRRLESELWACEARLNALMDTAPEAVLVIHGRSGRILKVNNQALLLFGYPPRELLGRQVEILIPDELQKKHVNLRMGFLNSVRKRELGLHPPIEALRKDGSPVLLEIALTATAATDDVMVVCRPAISAAGGLSRPGEEQASIA